MIPDFTILNSPNSRYTRCADSYYKNDDDYVNHYVVDKKYNVYISGNKNIRQVKKLDQAKTRGVYFYIGKGIKANELYDMYAGKGKKCGKRISTHHYAIDSSWISTCRETTVAFTPVTSWSEDEMNYVENELIRLLEKNDGKKKTEKKINKVNKKSSSNSLPVPATKNDLDCFVKTAIQVLADLGYPKL